MKKFLVNMISSNTEVSFGRSMAGIITLTWLIVCIILSIEKKEIADIPLQWAGLSAMFFGITKFGDAVSKPAPVQEGVPND